MSDRTLNIMKQQALAINSNIAYAKYGIITNYNPIDFLAIAEIQPEKISTGWLNISSLPNGTFFAPNIGDECLILYLEGDINGAIISLFVSLQKPSTQVNAGEVLIENVGKFNVNSDNILLGKNENDFLKLVTYKFKQLFNEHTHPQNNQPPTQQMDDSNFTDNTRAN